MTESPVTTAWLALPDDIRSRAEEIAGSNRPVTWPELLLLIGTAIAGKRERAWQPIETAPKDRTPVIVAVPTKDHDDYFVGEAYFHPDDEEWWWAGNAPGDYHGGPISDINYHGPSHWQPLPAAPEIKERIE